MFSPFKSTLNTTEDVRRQTDGSDDTMLEDIKTGYLKFMPGVIVVAVFAPIGVALYGVTLKTVLLTIVLVAAMAVSGVFFSLAFAVMHGNALANHQKILDEEAKADEAAQAAAAEVARQELEQYTKKQEAAKLALWYRRIQQDAAHDRSASFNSDPCYIM